MPIIEEPLMAELIDDSALPDPQSYQYYKQLYKRKIVLNEQIDDTIIESAVIPFMDMNRDGTNKPITIYLSTVGGELYNGFSLVDAIEEAEVPTTIHILAVAASMGIFIAMAGHNNPNVRTVCHSFSVGLLHAGSQYMEGDTYAVKDAFDFSQAYEDKIKQYVLSHTNIDEDLYEQVKRKEYWMDAEEMKHLGIVDEII